MASSEFPLRTNNELVRILNILNGSNEIEILMKMFPERVKYSWKVRNNKLYNTLETKSDPPHGYRIVKGLAFIVVTRAFVQHVLNDPKSIDLLKWGEDTFSPDEW